MSTKQEDRWDIAEVLPEKKFEVNAVVDKIMLHKDRYQYVDRLTNIPWYVIAAIHNMEGGLSFNTHLHNGDPLSSRTTHVPKGRPVIGNPPFTWEESAYDSLTKGEDSLWLKKVNWKSLHETLQACERYNGLGYQKHHPNIPSPYLWAKTNIERPGKYVADGHWDSQAISKQVGIVSIFKVMEERGILNFNKLERMKDV